MKSSAALDSPPLRVVRDAGTPLPAPLTSFIGRDKALADVADAVRAHRLVTLMGAGGSGKTRLAIEVARAVAETFGDGVTWVELAPLTDAALVSQTLAAALGIRHQPGRGSCDAISEYLANRRTLIVIDNCEHVIDAAADVIGSLLRDVPNVHILATSRERLGVPSERAWPVPPLDLPPRRARDLNDLLAADAVRLFLDRASAVLPTFAIDASAAAAIADICIGLDGIPLAIELAAARMNVLSPRQIADRLADGMALLTSGARTLPKRQRTLRAAIDWSYQLLPPQEQLLFLRLSVFAGSFTLDAAECVCGDAALPKEDVLDLLASLVDKSLIAVTEHSGEARYRMLETVDQYATELLAAAGDAHASLLRHAQYYCRIVEQYAPRLRSAVRPRVMPIIDAEHDNIRAALDWARATPGQALLHHRLVGQLWWYWLHRVLWDEGMQRFSESVALSDASTDQTVVAQMLYGGGVLAWVSGMFLQSRTWLERCVEIRRTLHDDASLGVAMCALSQPMLDLGERETALDLVRTGLPLAREGCNPWDLAVVLTTSYGYVHHATGNFDEAEQAYLEADALWSEPADDWGRSLARNSLAVVSWRRGDIERAATYARATLMLLRTVGDRWFTARTLMVLGYLALQQQRPERAAKLLAASEAMRSEVGARLMPFEVPEWNRATDATRELLGDRDFDAAWRAGSDVDFHGAIDLALADAPITVVTAPQPARARPAPEPALDVELELNALGPLEVRVRGRLLTNEDWTYAKPRELLFYLLCHEHGRTKDQIGLDMWPEATPARLRSSFHVTVHHLRRALGAPEWIAYEEGRYRFDRAHECAYDVDRFARLIDDAERTQDIADRIVLLERTVQLYRGDFLAGAGFGDWTLEHADRLRRRYAEAALELAAAYRADKRFADAERTVRALLARDNLDERAHRLLIEILADCGRGADAMRHYQVMAALLREELGIAPSAETAALVAALQ